MTLSHAHFLSLVKSLKNLQVPQTPRREIAKPAHKIKYVEKSTIKNSTVKETVLAANNALDTGTSVSAGVKLGSLSTLKYPIHPSCFVLFPNLKGIWRSFEQYRLDTTTIDCQPLASTLASGAYACSLVPSSEEDANILPIFSSLINYATTTAATIWKPMVYKFAGNILHRLGSYLMESEDQTTSSPGTLYISKT